MDSQTMGDGLTLEDFLPYRLSVLSAGMSQRLAALYGARFGISIPEWRVLAHLSQATGISVREIHQRVGMDKAKVSRAAARLEAAGHVEKRVNQSDARLVELSLTVRGRALFAEIAPLAKAFEAALLAGWTDDERATLDRLIRKLDAGLAQ